MSQETMTNVAATAQVSDPAPQRCGPVRSGRTRDVLLFTLLAVGVFFSRWCLRPDYLFTRDPLNAAGSVAHYDLGYGLPQPPGQPVYAILIRGVTAVVGSPHQAILFVSCAADAIAAVLIFWLAALAASRLVGWLACLIFILSPYGWSASTLGLTFGLDVAVAAGVGICVLLLHRKPSGMKAALVGGLVALSLGIRANVTCATFILFPLAFYGLARAGLRNFLKGAGGSLVVFAAWFVPMALLMKGSGGYLAYPRTCYWFWRTVVMRQSAIWPLMQGQGFSQALTMYTRDLAEIFERSVSAAGPALYLLPFLLIPVGGKLFSRRTPWASLLLWTVPLLVMTVPAGWHYEEYVAVALPGIAVLCAIAVCRAAAILQSVVRLLTRRRPDPNDRLASTFVTTHILTICLLNVLWFTLQLAAQPNESRSMAGRAMASQAAKMPGEVIYRIESALKTEADREFQAAYLRTIGERCRGKPTLVMAGDWPDFLQIFLYQPQQLCILTVWRDTDYLQVVSAQDGRITVRDLPKDAPMDLPADIRLIVAGEVCGDVGLKHAAALQPIPTTPRDIRALEAGGGKRIYALAEGKARIRRGEEGVVIEITPDDVPTTQSQPAGPEANPQR